MKYITLFLLVFCTGLHACKEGWTEEYRNEYLQTCRDGNHDWAGDGQVLEKYCNCALEHTMQHYGTIEEVVENADSTQLSAEITACRVAAEKPGN